MGVIFKWAPRASGGLSDAYYPTSFFSLLPILCPRNMHELWMGVIWGHLGGSGGASRVPRDHSCSLPCRGVFLFLPRVGAAGWARLWHPGRGEAHPRHTGPQGCLVGGCLGTTQLDSGPWLFPGLRTAGHGPLDRTVFGLSSCCLCGCQLRRGRSCELLT